MKLFLFKIGGTDFALGEEARQHVPLRAVVWISCHIQTLVIYKLGFNQNYLTFAFELLSKIVLCSKFSWTKLVNHEDLSLGEEARQHVPLRTVVWLRDWGSGFRVQGSRFRVQGLGFRVQGSGFGV